jgi:hypothetical protein
MYIIFLTWLGGDAVIRESRCSVGGGLEVGDYVINHFFDILLRHCDILIDRSQKLSVGVPDLCK